MTMQRIAKTTVQPPWCDLPLAELLVNRFTYHKREEWLRLLQDGRVSVNGRRARADQIVVRGDAIEYHIPPVQEPAVSTAYRIVLMDEGIVVIDKPANLPCHPAGRFFNHTLWAILRHDLHLDTLHFVSRLDRETSGLVLVATDQNAAKQCRLQADSKHMLKEYQVLVEGTFNQPQTARGWLCRDADSPVRKKRRFVPADSPLCAPPTSDALWCETTLAPIRCNGRTTLVKAILGTGRTHQIRATLNSLGFPIVGDKIYGVDDTFFLRFIRGALTETDAARLKLDRQALHASRLAFRMPRSGTPVNLVAPLPADMMSPA